MRKIICYMMLCRFNKKSGHEYICRNKSIVVAKGTVKDNRSIAECKNYTEESEK